VLSLGEGAPMQQSLLGLASQPRSNFLNKYRKNLSTAALPEREDRLGCYSKLGRS